MLAKNKMMKTALLFHYLLLLNLAVPAQLEPAILSSAEQQPRLRGNTVGRTRQEVSDQRLLFHSKKENHDPDFVRLPQPEQCSFDVSVRCEVYPDGDTSKEGIPCLDYEPPTLGPLQPCHETPLTTTLLYNGGNCKQTDNASELGITCKDGTMGYPPTQEGASSYLVVTDARGLGITYFEGTVKVGSSYSRCSTATIYATKNKAQQLQQVSYQPQLCSTKKELANRFGSLQVVGYTNKSQGEVAMFASIEVKSKVHVVATTNFAGFVDLNDQVKQITRVPPEPVVLTIPVDNLDLSQARRYTMLLDLTATEVPTGATCSTIEFHSFTIGSTRL